jgi:hypothetical protein
LGADFVAPRGMSWVHLCVWSLGLGDQLPHAAVPQFVDLYHRWSNANAGRDWLSPLLVSKLYGWLVEVEGKNHPTARGFTAWRAATEEPGLTMTSSQESDLRVAFLMWCKLQPDHAEAYLNWIAAHPHRHVLFRPLLSFVGTAAAAAPRALADLFLQALPEHDDEERDGMSPIGDLFSAWDIEYFPASPARAPFLDLLHAEKEQGLRLVRGVLAHAVARRSRGREPSEDRIGVPFPEGSRAFPWHGTYLWARDQDSHIVASALMALEAWAHLRIERGEPVQQVIDDVVCYGGAPAACLLVAVDAMLSHWPLTRECLWPFAASAELLAMDRQRFGFDSVNSGTGTGWVSPEPAGAVQLADLKGRPSRRVPLDAVLQDYGAHGPESVRESMERALHEEAARLGEPNGENGLADPRLAAVYALNRLDRANFVEAGVGPDGQSRSRYVPPADEERLFNRLQQRADQGTAEMVLRGQLVRALTEGHCSEALLERGLQWAIEERATMLPDRSGDELESIERTRFIVAALALRDGSLSQRATHTAWLSARMNEAASREVRGVHFPQQLPYNAAAIAAMGFLAVVRDDPAHPDLLRLLELAARRDTGMASVLTADVSANRTLRSDLARSLVRLGLTSTIYTLFQHQELEFVSPEDYRAKQAAQEEARKEAEHIRRRSAVEAEVRWLAGQALEPAWPHLPEPSPPRLRRRIGLDGEIVRRQLRTDGTERRFALDSSGAAKWLVFATAHWRSNDPQALAALVQHCWPWTAAANGVGCDDDEEPAERAFEWNSAYFSALVAVAMSMDGQGVQEVLIGRLVDLPEERFFDAAATVLHELDRQWVGEGRIADATAVAIREALAHRMVATRTWQDLTTRRSTGAEIHIAGTIAAMFCGQHEMGKGPRCYVLPPGADRAYLLLPMLAPLVKQAAGSTFVALAFIGLIEVRPEPSHLPILARIVASWWQVRGADSEFWNDYGIGRRVCNWIDKGVVEAASPPLESTDLAAVVDTLVQCGTPLARALEERIAARRGTT